MVRTFGIVYAEPESGPPGSYYEALCRQRAVFHQSENHRFAMAGRLRIADPPAEGDFQAVEDQQGRSPTDFGASFGEDSFGLNGNAQFAGRTGQREKYTWDDNL